MKKFKRGYPLMVKPGKRKAGGFYRPIKIKAALVPVSIPARITKNMTAHNEFWNESAEWVKRGGFWVCTIGTGVLSRLKGMSPAQARMELLRLGASWKWV